MKNKKIHFIGVGGAGCSAVFAIAWELGYKVSGCDNQLPSPYLDKKLSKFVYTGHSSSHLAGIDLLVYSPAVPAYDPQNEELKVAAQRGIGSIPWERFVARELLPNKFVIAVAGTHGKSTVTAMIGAILEKAGLDPTVLVGALVSDWGRNYRVGKSKYFVLEADEYGEKFINFPADIGVITNVEFDHPEYFHDFEQLKKAFEKFTANMKKGSLLITGPNVDLENHQGRTVRVVKPEDWPLKMIGGFNKLNAEIAAAVARGLLVDENKIKNTLERFNGLARRFEFRGEEKGVLVFDDYAHHPTAVLKTLKAAREKFPAKKVWVVFQPHLYSRTKTFFNEFVIAFESSPVEKIILVDIFGAREKDTGEVKSLDLAKAIKGKEIKYFPGFEEAATYLAKETFSGDVVICMGAGDIYKLPEVLLGKLAGKG